MTNHAAAGTGAQTFGFATLVTRCMSLRGGNSGFTVCFEVVSHCMCVLLSSLPSSPPFSTLAVLPSANPPPPRPAQPPSPLAIFLTSLPPFPPSHPPPSPSSIRYTNSFTYTRYQRMVQRSIGPKEKESMRQYMARCLIDRLVGVLAGRLVVGSLGWSAGRPVGWLVSWLRQQQSQTFSSGLVLSQMF